MDQSAQKRELAEWLMTLKDKSLIDFLARIKDSVSNDTDWWGQLSDTQKASIERGIKDIENGRSRSHESVIPW